MSGNKNGPSPTPITNESMHKKNFLKTILEFGPIGKKCPLSLHMWNHSYIAIGD